VRPRTGVTAEVDGVRGLSVAESVEDDNGMRELMSRRRGRAV
jgi:hypothetical protein